MLASVGLSGDYATAAFAAERIRRNGAPARGEDVLRNGDVIESLVHVHEAPVPAEHGGTVQTTARQERR